MRTKITLLITFALMAFTMSAQYKVSGVVKDSNGQPLPGVSVTVANSSTGTSTDFDGLYSLNVKKGDQVSFSSVGFVSVTKDMDGSEEVNITMAEGMALDEVLITGTRSKPRTAINSAVPIDNLSPAAIEKQNTGDMVQTLKALVPSFTATPLTGDGSAFVKPTSLRGLPPDEVLVLMNSKRRHRSALIAHFGAAMNAGAHASDIGHIPSIALKNVEVLRDGAAAQYGSDAIAGVMNFILKDANKGAEVQAQVGQWYGRNYGSETDYKVGMNFGMPLTEKGFLNISAEYSYNPQLERGNQHEGAQAAEDAGLDVPYNPGMSWGRPENSGIRTTWNAGVDLEGNMELYSFGNFSKTVGKYGFFYRGPNKNGYLETMPINPNNPAEGNFSWNDTFSGGFRPTLEGNQTDISGVVGVKGEFFGGIKYDISGSFGYNRLNYTLFDSLSSSWGPYSQTEFKPGDLQQNDKNFNIDFSKAISEKFNLAGGFESRKETYTMYLGDKQSWMAGPWSGISNLINPATGDPYSEPGIGPSGFTGTSPVSAGSWDSQNWALYLDGEYDITEKFLVQVALRHEDFKLYGTTDNYKVASRYSFSDKLTLRGAYSTGFRAPTVGQSNVTTVTTTFDIGTGQILEGTVRPTDAIAIPYGGKALTPEQSKNLSVGLTSKITKNITLTADYYSVAVDDRIVKSQAIDVSADPSLIYGSLAFYTNALNTTTQGVDFVANAKFGKSRVSLAYNFNETKVVGQTQVNGVNPVSEGGIFNLENNLPKNRASLSLGHDFGKFDASIRANYYGDTFDERSQREKIDARTLVDLDLSYQASDAIKLVLGGINIFNTYPNEVETRASQGMPFPRRTPIGYSGGQVYFKAVYKL